MKRLFLLISIVLIPVMSFAGEGAPALQIVNVSGRETVSLYGLWKTIVDPYENGYYNYRMAPHDDGA